MHVYNGLKVSPGGSESLGFTLYVANSKVRKEGEEKRPTKMSQGDFLGG